MAVITNTLQLLMITYDPSVKVAFASEALFFFLRSLGQVRKWWSFKTSSLKKNVFANPVRLKCKLPTLPKYALWRKCHSQWQVT